MPEWLKWELAGGDIGNLCKLVWGRGVLEWTKQHGLRQGVQGTNYHEVWGVWMKDLGSVWVCQDGRFGRSILLYLDLLLPWLTWDEIAQTYKGKQGQHGVCQQGNDFGGVAIMAIEYRECGEGGTKNN